jgi:hypothetical protein
MARTPAAVPADHYLELARSLRERASDVQTEEARFELLAIALEYERLAAFVESSDPAGTA